MSRFDNAWALAVGYAIGVHSGTNADTAPMSVAAAVTLFFVAFAIFYAVSWLGGTAYGAIKHSRAHRGRAIRADASTGGETRNHE